MKKQQKEKIFKLSPTKPAICLFPEEQRPKEKIFRHDFLDGEKEAHDDVFEGLLEMFTGPAYGELPQSEKKIDGEKEAQDDGFEGLFELFTSPDYEDREGVFRDQPCFVRAVKKQEPEKLVSIRSLRSNISFKQTTEVKFEDTHLKKNWLEVINEDLKPEDRPNTQPVQITLEHGHEDVQRYKARMPASAPRHPEKDADKGLSRIMKSGELQPVIRHTQAAGRASLVQKLGRPKGDSAVSLANNFKPINSQDGKYIEHGLVTSTNEIRQPEKVAHISEEIDLWKNGLEDSQGTKGKFDTDLRGVEAPSDIPADSLDGFCSEIETLFHYDSSDNSCERSHIPCKRRPDTGSSLDGWSWELETIFTDNMVDSSGEERSDTDKSIIFTETESMEAAELPSKKEGGEQFFRSPDLSQISQDLGSRLLPCKYRDHGLQDPSDISDDIRNNLFDQENIDQVLLASNHKCSDIHRQLVSQRESGEDKSGDEKLDDGEILGDRELAGKDTTILMVVKDDSMAPYNICSNLHEDSDIAPCLGNGEADARGILDRREDCIKTLVSSGPGDGVSNIEGCPADLEFCFGDPQKQSVLLAGGRDAPHRRERQDDDPAVFHCICSGIEVEPMVLDPPLAQGYKLSPRHETMDGTETTTLGGKTGETDSRHEAKILKLDIQKKSIIDSQGLPEVHQVPHPRFNSGGTELNNIMKPCDILLCSLTQQLKSTFFSDGKFLVSKHTLGRTVMILEGREFEPANDKLFQFIMYTALIFTVVALGMAILLALFYIRSYLKRCLKRTCWDEEVEQVSGCSSGTEFGLRNGDKVGIPADQLEEDQDSSEEDDDGIAVVIKGVQEDQVRVFIVKGVASMDIVSSHTPGAGTKCGHARQTDGSCLITDIATVDDDAECGHERQKDGSCLITDIATMDDDADNVSLADRAAEETADTTEQSVQATPGL